MSSTHLLRFLRPTPVGVFAMLIGTAFVVMVTPMLAARVLPPTVLSCEAALQDTRAFDGLRPVRLEGCTARQGPERVDDVDEPLLRMDPGVSNEGKAIFLRLPGDAVVNEGARFDAEVYAHDLSDDDVATAIRRSLRLPDRPVVLTDLRLLDPPSMVANAIILLIGLLCVAVPLRTMLGRARLARARAALEEDIPAASDSALVVSISVTHAAHLTRWLRWARVPLMLAFLMLLVAIADDLTSPGHAAMDLAMTATLIALGGVIHAMRSGARAGHLAFAALPLCISLVTLLGVDLQPSKLTMRDLANWALLVGPLLPLWALFTWRGRSRLANTGLTLTEMNDAFRARISFEGLAPLRRLLLPGQYSVRGLVRMSGVGAAILIGLLATVLGAPWVWWLLVLWVIPAYRKARQQLVPDAREVLERDPRPPVLLLRAFMDDVVEAEGLSGSTSRFEEQLTTAAAPVGPPVAIGDPKEDMPELGAYRTYCDDDSWQAQVEHWMEASRMVLMVAGTTEMLGWEVKKTIERGYLHKLVIAMPPEDLERRLFRWEMFRRHFEGTPFEAASLEVEPRTLLACAFAEDGSIVAVTSAEFTQIDYELALGTIVALGHVDQGGPSVPTP